MTEPTSEPLTQDVQRLLRIEAAAKDWVRKQADGTGGTALKDSWTRLLTALDGPEQTQDTPTTTPWLGPMPAADRARAVIDTTNNGKLTHKGAEWLLAEAIRDAESHARAQAHAAYQALVATTATMAGMVRRLQQILEENPS